MYFIFIICGSWTPSVRTLFKDQPWLAVQTITFNFSTCVVVQLCGKVITPRACARYKVIGCVVIVVVIIVRAKLPDLDF